MGEGVNPALTGRYQLRPRLRCPSLYLGLALDPAYIEGFVEGCLERIGEDDSEGGGLAAE